MNAIFENREKSDKSWTNHDEYVENMPELFGVIAAITCNLKCVMCPGHGHPHINALPAGPKLFDRDLLTECVTPFTKAYEFEFQGYCEPFLTERFWDITSFAQRCSAEPSLRRLCIISNGNFAPTPKNIERATGDSIKKITFSVDAGTEDTYRFVRGGDFSLLQRSVAEIAAARNAKGLTKDLSLGTTYVLMRSNMHELPKHIELFSKLGVDFVDVSQLLQPQKKLLKGWTHERNGRYFSYEEELILDVSSLEKILVDAKKIADDNNIALYASHILSGSLEIKKPSDCYWPYKRAYVATGGDVYPCCFNIERPMGNIRNNTFEAIWNGEEYKKMRRSLSKDELPSICQGLNCPYSTQHKQD